MKTNDIIALAKAGFTADQILKMAQPQPQPQPQPANNDPILAQLAALTSAIQANGIINSNQPKQETADDILAKILDPSLGKEE